jgi:1,4-dihydroxy-2-naphthoate octaprenyltransferase
VTAQPDLHKLTVTAWWGMLAATLIITGIYPVTQIYQIEEDLARGDLTFAAWLGPQRTLWFAVLMQTLGAGVLVWMLYGMYGALQALLIGAAYATTLAVLLHWSFTFDPAAIIPNYRRVMGITLTTSVGFLFFLALHLIGVLK